MKTIIEKYQLWSKRQKFMAILGVLAFLALVASLLTRVTFFKEDTGDFLRIAIAAPMSGVNGEIGRSMRQGAEFFVEGFNAAGGINGQKVALVFHDDGDNADKAKAEADKIAKLENRAVAVVGHWSDDAARAAGAVYRQGKIPVITPASLPQGLVVGNDWHFSTVFSEQEQARFLANYTRNVLGHKLISIIKDEAGLATTMAVPFEETYGRFGTTIRYQWSIDSSAADLDFQFSNIMTDLKTKQDAGAMFLAVRAPEGARLLKMLREAGYKGLIVAPNMLATRAFNEMMAGEVKKPKDPGSYTNQMLVASPLLFDTANESAQNLLDGYQRTFGTSPDWVAAYAYDATKLAVEGIRRAIEEGKDGDTGTMRTAIRDFLATQVTSDSPVNGVTGPTIFSQSGESQTPVLVGTYNGANIISALTQLQPIRQGGVANYIEELKQGRVLYVNDRFMYKTNVVYTGIQIKEVSALDVALNKYTLDLNIWFRYRGDFAPQDVVFNNAVEPIKLTEPAEEKVTGAMIYRLYRVKGDFSFDFTDTNRFYGTHVAGASFSHRTLNRNNLLYVKDVLGLGLESGDTVLDMVKRARAIPESSGWIPERAWLSQDVARKESLGDPLYVGHASTDPDFSRIDLGILLKPGTIQVRDFIPAEFFLYIGIFGLVGTLGAIWMDSKEKGRFWHAQSWVLRAASWPLLLLASGNLLLELAFDNLPVQYIDVIVLIYDILWWLVPARLAGIAMERFVWIPLEDHTERTIPNVVRVFVSVLIYSLASFGVIAFVFGEQLTSLLATSGLLAMIIGLAIQSNIANIFSGIVINVERPFSVGDWVKIGEMDEGKIVDITWRTTRVKTRNGYVISVPNGKVSEAEVHNFDSFDVIRLEIPITVAPEHNADKVNKIIMTGLTKVPQIVAEPEAEVRFLGVAWNLGWVANYEIQCWIENYSMREDVEEEIQSIVWHELEREGIKPNSSQSLSPVAVPT